MVTKIRWSRSAVGHKARMSFAGEVFKGGEPATTHTERERERESPEVERKREREEGMVDISVGGGGCILVDIRWRLVVDLHTMRQI